MKKSKRFKWECRIPSVSKFLRIMRLTSLLLVLSTLGVLANKTYSQSNISLTMENTTVKAVLVEIENQSGYNFMYSGNIIDVKRKISIDIIGDINSVLKSLFAGTDINYTINDRIILLSRDRDFQQGEIIVKGKVTDVTDHTLPGVTILLKGTNNGTITDAYGSYTFKVPADASLVFSFIGMKSQEIAVEGRTSIDVVLEEESKGLDEVVIVGYGTQKKGSVIGSVDRIEPAQLKQPTRTISTSLAGRLAGVISVQSSGEPGYDGATFWIRGVNTFTGSQTPLVLVDGIERNLDNVDPEEIADFTILKDATATAVYGVRGANGVVLITTKKGTVSAPKINLKIETGLTSPIDLPDFVDGPTYMILQNEALLNEGQTPVYSQSRIDNTIAGTDPYYYPNVNWMDALMKDYNVSQRVNLNISGGSERVQYFISGSFLKQDGMYKSFKVYNYDNNINYKRYNFRSNVDVNLTKTTLMSLNLSSILTDGHTPGHGSESIFGVILKSPPTAFPLQLPDKTKQPGTEGLVSPFSWLAASGYNDYYRTLNQSNISALQDLSFIVQGLKAKVTFSYDTYTSANVAMLMNPRRYMIVPWGYDEDGNPILKNEDGEYNHVDQNPSSDAYDDYLVRSASSPYTDRSVYLEGSLIYNRTFNKHDFGGLLLFNRSNTVFPSSSGVYESVPKRYQGVTGRTSYTYDKKYFIEFNCGYNGSENFAKGHRYGFFPALAIGWVPTEENFMASLKPVIDYMKIRLSYGKVGNDQIGSVSGVSRFAYLTRVEASGRGVSFGTDGNGYGSGTGVNITYFGSDDASWETANKADLGLELNFKNGIGLQTDLFYEKRTDIWTGLSKIADIFGLAGKIPGGNVGEMENKGIDGFISYLKRINNDLSVNVKGTFTFAKNKVKANGAETPEKEYQSQISQPYGRSLGYVAEHLFVDQAEIDNCPDQSYLGTVQPGDIKYKDIDKNGVIDAFDRIYIGHPNIPEMTYGLGANVNYKDFDFSFLFQGAARVSFYAKPQAFTDVQLGNVWAFTVDNRWTKENQNIYADIPRLGVGSQNNNFVNSTHWLRDGSYLRLKQLEVGYSLPKKILNAVHILGARFYVNGVNLFTWSPFKWWDPEAQSINGMQYPPQKVINMGLEVKF